MSDSETFITDFNIKDHNIKGGTIVGISKYN